MEPSKFLDHFFSPGPVVEYWTLGREEGIVGSTDRLRPRGWTVVNFRTEEKRGRTRGEKRFHTDLDHGFAIAVPKREKLQFRAGENLPTIGTPKCYFSKQGFASLGLGRPFLVARSSGRKTLLLQWKRYAENTYYIRLHKIIAPGRKLPHKVRGGVRDRAGWWWEEERAHWPSGLGWQLWQHKTREKEPKLCQPTCTHYCCCCYIHVLHTTWAPGPYSIQDRSSDNGGLCL